MNRLLTDYRDIFLRGTPLLDTRAPAEFARGSFPGAVNLPLMTDDERAQVGTCYKQRGQEAAIALGHRLVSDELRAARIAAWADFARRHPQGCLFCFRGGLRSQIAQGWLAEAGVDYPRIAGGYKAMRHFLLDVLDTAARRPLWVLGGMTGTGKTEVLAELDNAVDLEACANHRGSGFGKRVGGQPAQIDFEHRLALRLLQLDAAQAPLRVVEDEGHFIGSCSLPETLREHMARAPLVWLEDCFDNRVARIHRDYVIEQHADHVRHYGPAQGFAHFAAHLLDSLHRIRKRLGGVRYQQVLQQLQSALHIQQDSGDTQAHRRWIETLLGEYYDPMYRHQQAGKAGRIIFAGPRDAVLAYLQQTQETHHAA